MRPMALKRKRNGKYAVRRNRRLRPKLTKHDRVVVRAAVRKVTRNEETKRSDVVVGGLGPSSWKPMTNPSGLWTSDRRYSHVWFINALDGMLTGTTDSDILGSSCFLKSFVFDYNFMRGQLSSTVFYPMPIWYRLDLVRCPLQIISNGEWTNNNDATLGQSWYDGTTTGSFLLWKPGTYIDRRTFKSIKTITGVLGSTDTITSSADGTTIDNAASGKHIYCKVRINKKVQFDSSSLDSPTTSYQLKTYNYAWVLAFYIPYYVPSSYNPSFFPIFMNGMNSVYFKDS